jgi:signal transduction histidine kinase
MTQHQLVESEKLAALGGLVAGIAHEVNTPLGVGVTAASHLEQQAQQFRAAMAAGTVSSQQTSMFSQTVSDASAMVLRNLQRADKMIRSFKQVAVDQTSEAPRLIQLAAYMDEILVSLQPVLKRSPHELKIDVPAGLTVYTQPGAIYQIVVNLVTNSMTHAFTGIAHGRMQIQAAADGDGWVLHYSDNGVGMEESVRRRIYDPFFTTRRGQGGSGLGMHIVYKLVVQTLDGSIECESAIGQGTRFHVHFPHR